MYYGQKYSPTETEIGNEKRTKWNSMDRKRKRRNEGKGKRGGIRMEEERRNNNRQRGKQENTENK
jgi:hypothetical protein